MAQILTGNQVFKVVVESTPMKRMVQDVDTGGISTSKQLEMQGEIDANKTTNDAQTTSINNIETTLASNNAQTAANTTLNQQQDERIAANAAMNTTQNNTISTMQTQIVENAEYNDELDRMDPTINSEGQVEINNVSMDGGIF